MSYIGPRYPKEPSAGDIAINLFTTVVVALLVLLLLTFFAILHEKPEDTRECEAYANRLIRDVPARCYNYYVETVWKK